MLILKKFVHPGGTTQNPALEETLNSLVDNLYINMSDDFNTAKTLAVLFEMSARIYDFKSGNTSLAHVASETFEHFKAAYVGFMEDVLGLRSEEEHHQDLLQRVIQVLIDLRKKAREDKNYKLSDKIRDDLKAMGVQLMDGKNGEMSFTLE